VHISVTGCFWGAGRGFQTSLSGQSASSLEKPANIAPETRRRVRFDLAGPLEQQFRQIAEQAREAASEFAASSNSDADSELESERI
jgi:hypothetical protein